MTKPSLNRRTLMISAFTVATAASFVTMGARPARAATELAPLRALHRFGLGDMTVSVIDDARFTFPAPMFAANQPEGRMSAFLGGYGLPQDTVSAHMQITLVETGGRKVLLDTGMGDITFPGNEPDNGRLFAGLAALGVTPEDITDVVLSHGHPDHVGGCALNGKPCFPNATHHIDPAELEFWTQKPGEEETFLNAMLGMVNTKLAPLEGLIRTFKHGEEIAGHHRGGCTGPHFRPSCLSHEKR